MAGANEVYSFMRYGQTANYSKMALLPDDEAIKYRNKIKHAIYRIRIFYCTLHSSTHSHIYAHSHVLLLHHTFIHFFLYDLFLVFIRRPSSAPNTRKP